MILAILSSLALAQTESPLVTLGLDLGHHYTGQPDYDLFEGNALMLGLGARAQVAVHDRVQIVGTWARSQRGGTLDVPEVGDPSSDFPEVRTVLTVDQFALGPRGDIEVNEMFFPYVTLQGVVWRGLVRLDDDPDTATNPNQLRSTGVSGGVQALAGFEIRVPDNWFSVYAEFGHRWIGSAGIGDLGSIRPRGYVQRLGVGFRL